MTPGDRERLETIRSRIDHVAATAEMAATLGDLPSPHVSVVAGIAETLAELAERMDSILHQSA